jgi:hypothetical protein
MCLFNVFTWFGSVDSIGPGSGHYSVAIAGWDYTPESERHTGDFNAPAGVPVYFDRLTRPRYTGDKNFAAGDVGLSVGNGYAIFTDSPTGNTGIMSIRARAAQIGRRYLGWTESFLGHQTSAGLAHKLTTPPAVIVVVADVPIKLDPTTGDRMYAIRNNAKTSPGYGAIFALAPGYVKHENDKDVALRLQTIAGDARDIDDLNTLQDVFEAFGVPRAAADANWLITNANAGPRTYSALVAALK